MAEQIHDLPFADDVTDFLGRARGRPGSFTFCRFLVQPAGFHKIFYRLIERPLAGVQIHIYTDARGPVTGQSQSLPLPRRVARIKASAREHLFAVEGPSFDKNRVLVLATDLVG